MKPKITTYFHCAHCIDQRPDHIAPRDWAQLNVGQMDDGGIQVWCLRCDMAVVTLPAGTPPPVPPGERGCDCCPPEANKLVDAILAIAVIVESIPGGREKAAFLVGNITNLVGHLTDGAWGEIMQSGKCPPECDCGGTMMKLLSSINTLRVDWLKMAKPSVPPPIKRQNRGFKPGAN